MKLSFIYQPSFKPNDKLDKGQRFVNGVDITGMSPEQLPRLLQVLGKSQSGLRETGNNELKMFKQDVKTERAHYYERRDTRGDTLMSLVNPEDGKMLYVLVNPSVGYSNSSKVRVTFGPWSENRVGETVSSVDRFRPEPKPEPKRNSKNQSNEDTESRDIKFEERIGPNTKLVMSFGSYYGELKFIGFSKNGSPAEEIKTEALKITSKFSDPRFKPKMELEAERVTIVPNRSVTRGHIPIGN